MPKKPKNFTEAKRIAYQRALDKEYDRLHKKDWAHSPNSSRAETAESMLRRYDRAKKNLKKRK